MACICCARACPLHIHPCYTLRHAAYGEGLRRSLSSASAGLLKHSALNLELQLYGGLSTEKQQKINARVLRGRIEPSGREND
jgi:hypothetical protein